MHKNIYACMCIFITCMNIYCCCYCLVAKSCSTLCDTMDCSLTGSSVHGISQAKILERGAIAFSISQLCSQINVTLLKAFTFRGLGSILIMVLLFDTVAEFFPRDCLQSF